MKYPTAPAKMRDAVIDFILHWSNRTGISISSFLAWLGMANSTFYNWRDRYGLQNRHNGVIPRHFWLEDWEKQAIIT